MADTKKKAPAKKAERKQRSTQILTLTEAKAVEMQIATYIRQGQKLQAKLDEIVSRFPDAQTYTPQQVALASKAFAGTDPAAVEALALFSEISDKYRSFFG